MFSKLRFETSRAIKSLTNCRSENGLDPLFKLVTLINITKKAARKVIPCQVTIELNDWNFHELIIDVNFEGIRFKFYCPCRSELNVFLNPYYHEYDVPLFAREILKKGDTCVDVGAYGGLYTLLAGRIVGSEGRVLSFEANPNNVKMLMNNVRLNRLYNVEIIPKAAGKETSIVKLFYNDTRGAFTSAHRKAEKVIEAEVVTLDSLTEEIDEIKLLKIDTEGSDLDVLKGARKTLVKTRFIVIEQDDLAVRKLLLDSGFRLQLLEASRNLIGKNESKISLQHEYEQYKKVIGKV